jgi:hypothetical protein
MSGGDLAVRKDVGDVVEKTFILAMSSINPSRQLNHSAPRSWFSSLFMAGPTPLIDRFFLMNDLGTSSESIVTLSA